MHRHFSICLKNNSRRYVANLFSVGTRSDLVLEFCFPSPIVRLSSAINANLAPAVIANLRLDPEVRSEIVKSCKFVQISLSLPPLQRKGICTLMNINVNNISHTAQIWRSVCNQIYEKITNIQNTNIRKPK